MINTAYFLAIFFIFIRLTSFFIISKFLFPKGTPQILKGVLALILSYCVVSGIDYNSLLAIENNYMLIIYLISEVLCGLILGFVVNLIFEFVKMAGSLIDLQIGLSMMNVVDPISNQNVTIISNLTYYLAAMMFFLTDGHHILIKCLIKSFSIVPIGTGINFSNSFETILTTFIKYFEIGVRIAIPLILVILISDMAMALVSRSVPQINVMILGIPIKIIVGLLTFIALLPIIIKTLTYAFNGIDNILGEILKSFLAAPVIFIFAKDDKTEEATGKKLADARKKGQVAKSKDVSLAVSLVTCTMLIVIATGLIGSILKDVMQYYLQSGILQEVNELSLKTIVVNIIGKAALCILPVIVPIALAGIIGNFIQVGFLFSTESLKPSFGKLNPINGFRNMFSMKSLVDLGKNTIVVTLISILAFSFVKENYSEILQAGNLRITELGVEVRNLVLSLFFRICLFMVVLAVADFVIQKRIFKKDMRMTKQEVKDEYKQMEGDPKIKSKIKQKQREIASRRMMEAVPNATVVVTNPTHLSIALKYEDGEMNAPKVVAKGADMVALRIKEIAKENDVPIMENKTLARMLYEKVEIDEEIPHDMYQAVAEILAMVFNLKNKK